MDTGKDKDSMGERGSSLVWKEPINGKTAFFTEEVYQQMAGPEPSLEDKVMKMMDALGFPPPSKVRASRRSGFPGAQQKSVENWTSSEGCSQDIFTASAAAPPEVKNENTASTSQPTPKSESKEKGGDSAFVSIDTPASPDTPMSPPPHDDALAEHYTVYCEPQSDTSNLAVTSTCPSTSNRDKASVSLETEISDSKQSQEHQGQAKDNPLPMEVSIHQSWTESNVNDNISNVGQIRSSAPHSKKHDKARRPPVPEARKSSLTHDQHIRYMFLFKKFSQRFFSGFCNPPTPSEHLELQEFEGLQLQVAREQEECQTYLKQMAQLNPYFYTHLPTHVSQYTKEKEEGGWKRVENYCRYYNTDGHLPLMLDLPQPGPSLTLCHTLLELGSKCKVVMPDLNPNPNTRFRRTVNMELQKISARFPPVYHSSQRAWNHEPASKDSNLDSLVQKYSCQIATSASVLHQLINNHAPDFAVAWDIPVVVRQYGNGAASQKVVFLDKPLLPKSRSACEKKIQYLRKAVRAYICQPHNERKSQGNRGSLAGRGRTAKNQEAGDGRSVAHGRTLSTKTEDDDPFGSVSMEDLETFGSDKTFSRSTRKGADVKGGKGKQRGINTQKKNPGSHVSEALGAKMPVPVTKPDVQDEQGSMQTFESTSHKEDVLAGSEPKQEAEEKDSQNTAKTNPSSSMNPPDTGTKSGPKSSETCEQQEPSSDSDMDALVIADVFSPSPTKPAGSPVKFPQHSPRRSSRNSRNSIFDEVPEFMTAVPDSSLEQAATSVFSSRRITRSVSQKLQSPDTREEGQRSASVDENSVLDLSQKNTASTDQGSVTPVETAAIPGASASPRITRQSAKRKLSEPVVTSEPESSSSAVEEPACSSKKGRKVGGQTEDPTATSEGVDRMEQDALGTEEKVELEENDGSALAKSESEKETKSEKEQSCGAAPSYLDSLLTEMTSSANSTKIKLQENKEDPRQYSQLGSPGDHIGYHLWDLSGMALIVRCNSHAFVRDMRQQEKCVHVMAKPERQVPHGLEQNTLSECVGGWLGCYLRPNSYLLRARVNMQNSEVVHTEELQLNQILHPTLNFSPHHAFAVLRNIFAKLTELSPGSYLLSHEAGANSVMLRCATETRRGSYDLRAQYMGLIMQEVDRSVAWVPVDPTLILPYHWKMGLIPVTFQPADFDPKRKKQQFAAPKKKQRNKKKQN